MITKSFATELRSLDETQRRVTFTTSTEVQDRYSDVIRVSGWRLDNYRKNPVVLWSHRSGDPPIAKCVKIWTESNPPALVQTVQFADAATYPFSDTVFKLVKDRFINGCSVGFLPLEEPSPAYDADGNPTGGMEFTSQELLELSITPVPANPQALARAVQKGILTDKQARAFESDPLDSLFHELFAPSQELDITKFLDEVAESCSPVMTALRNCK